MNPRLLAYYNQELAHLREMGAEFAREYPKVAARLGMAGLEVADPYVERLLEGFAFIAGRVQLKIDAEFPRFTQHLLEIVYPHYLAPTPSFMMLEFQPRRGDPSLVEGQHLPRGTRLRSVVPRGEQTACEFRTAHDITLWPLTIESARYFSHAPDLPLGQLGLSGRARAGLRIGLRCDAGANLGRLACERLPFYIDAADEVAGPLYELIHGCCEAALILVPGEPRPTVLRLPADAVNELGFADEQALLPHDHRSFQGYRLLSEYFAFPERFNFFEITGLRKAFEGRTADRCELVLLFGRNHPRLEQMVDAASFKLHATPAVNLFSRRADRVPLSDGSAEYHLVVDRARPMDFEVYGISSVRGLYDDGRGEVTVAPFYADAFHAQRQGAPAFYTMRREPRLLSERQRRAGGRTGYVGSEVYLSLVDEREAPYPPGMQQLSVEVLATNRDLPLLLPLATHNPLTLEDARPVERIAVLKGPTRPRGPRADGDYAWRLISHLSLNQLSLFGDSPEAGGAQALRELLELYCDPGDTASRKPIEALQRLTARPAVRRLPMAGPIVFGRGLELELTINEAIFGGAGIYLMGSVLEKFFARHVSINSFTQSRLTSESRGEVGRWPARTGTRIIA